MAGSKKFYNNVLKVFSALVLTLAIMLNSVGISKLYVVKADYVTTWGAISTVFDATPGEKLHIEVEVKMTDLNYSTNQGSVSNLSGGTRTIILTVLISTIVALIKPINEAENI